MKISKIRVAFGNPWTKGLDYYIDKEGKVEENSTLLDRREDVGKYYTLKQSDEKIIEELRKKCSKIAKKKGCSLKNAQISYAYALNLYDEVLKVYKIVSVPKTVTDKTTSQDNSTENLEITSQDIDDFYREVIINDNKVTSGQRTLKEDEIDEGIRQLSICGIRDGIKESKDCSIIEAWGLFWTAIVHIAASSSREKALVDFAHYVEVILVSALVAVTIFLLRSIKKALYYRDKLLNGLEPDDEKRKVLSKSIFKYLKGEENKEEKKRQ